jgi:hypothetical protein
MRNIACRRWSGVRLLRNSSAAERNGSVGKTSWFNSEQTRRDLAASSYATIGLIDLTVVSLKNVPCTAHPDDAAQVQLAPVAAAASTARRAGWQESLGCLDSTALLRYVDEWALVPSPDPGRIFGSPATDDDHVHCTCTGVHHVGAGVRDLRAECATARVVDPAMKTSSLLIETTWTDRCTVEHVEQRLHPRTCGGF